MIKRILIVFFLGIIIGLTVFLIQLKRGKIKYQEAEDKTEPTQTIVQTTPTEEDILQGKISFYISSIVQGDIFTIDRVRLIIPGFLVVYESDTTEADDIIGVSPLLAAGESNEVSFKLKRNIVSGEKIYVGIHSDNGNGIFDGPGKDIPIRTRGSILVRKEFQVGI